MRVWSVRTGTLLPPDLKRLIGRQAALLEDRVRYAEAFSAKPLRWSYAANFLWRLLAADTRADQYQRMNHLRAFQRKVERDSPAPRDAHNMRALDAQQAQQPRDLAMVRKQPVRDL